MTLLSLLALGFAVLTIAADNRGKWRLGYVARPLAMLSIVAIAWSAKGAFAPPYKTFILAGLGCSLVGDIFMMLRKKRFIEGLASFLVAQLFYIAAFKSGIIFSLSSLTFISFVIFAMLVSRLFFPYLGSLKFPVVVYVFVIVTMAGLAAERFIQIGGTKTLFAFAGAILFVVSDLVLAVNRFVKPFRLAQLCILSTYFLAQWLIAMSV